MKQDKVRMIKYECARFCKQLKLDEEKRVELEKLAFTDYLNCNARDRAAWSLKAMTGRLQPR